MAEASIFDIANGLLYIIFEVAQCIRIVVGRLNELLYSYMVQCIGSTAICQLTLVIK